MQKIEFVNQVNEKNHDFFSYMPFFPRPMKSARKRVDRIFRIGASEWGEGGRTLYRDERGGGAPQPRNS